MPQGNTSIRLYPWLQVDLEAPATRSKSPKSGANALAQRRSYLRAAASNSAFHIGAGHQ